MRRETLLICLQSFFYSFLVCGMYHFCIHLLMFVISSSSEIKHFLFEQKDDSLPILRLEKQHGTSGKIHELKQMMESGAIISEPESAIERKLVQGLMMLNRLTEINSEDVRHLSKDLMNRIVGDSNAVALPSLMNALDERLRMIHIWVSVR